ncbi:unnamed protein product [Zymoseptoria tritici ST99CH_3D1]|nr:unnamed protein product [Zymoseptoria tritici ST99CH_3D1]
MTTTLATIDAKLTALLADWSLSTTLLALFLALILLTPILFPSEPDTHPLLLARQSIPSPVRARNESAVYRSPESPHGYPLRSGLNVKEPGAPRWAGGKDGDLRDVWREVCRGGEEGGEGKSVPKGVVMSVFGKSEVVEHDLGEMSGEIGVLGRSWKEGGCGKVAVYLPNSVEFLESVFACTFYGITPVLLPFNIPHEKVYELLKTTGADGLVVAAGTLPLDAVAKQCPNLKQLTWVVEKTSKHMDWSGTSQSASSRLSVNVWHDLVESQKSTASKDLPSNTPGETPPDFIVVSQPTSSSLPPTITTFTQSNLVAAIASLLTALPTRQRLSSADLLLPASPLNETYTFTHTLAALYTHTSLALTSVAAPGVEISLATRGIAPTVIIASPETLSALHVKETAGITSSLQKFGKYSQSQTVSAGRMPTDNLLFKFLAPSSSTIQPGKLRLIFTATRIGAGEPVLTSNMLSDLRIFTRARIVHALSAPSVAGAISQTNVFDYRAEDGTGHGHFGVPLSCVEVKLVSADGTDDGVGKEEPRGRIVVLGKSVVGGEVEVSGVEGVFRRDGTLALV